MTVVHKDKTIGEQEAHAIGVTAYTYFYPLITMDLTRRQLTNVARAEVISAPMNAFASLTAFPPADMKAVVRPNFDTLGSLAWLELTGLPVDAERWVARAQHEAVRVRLLEAQLHDLVGSEAGQFSFLETPRVNWQSPGQVRALLHARGHQLTATDSKTLSTLADPLVPVLLEYRDAVKRAGTYGREWIEKYCHAQTGRLHADYFQLGAWSRPLAAVTVIGAALLFLIGVQPPNDALLDYTGGLLALMAVLWFGVARKRFPGPPAEKALGGSS